MKMSLAGLAAVLSMAASAAPTAVPAQAAASENWMMRVSYEGEPYWISVRDMGSTLRAQKVAPDPEAFVPFMLLSGWVE